MSESYDLSGLIDEFREEASQQIDLLESALRDLEDGHAPSEEGRAELLRALHTLKGNAAMLGLGAVRDYVHAVETFFKAPPRRVDDSALEPLFEGTLALRRLLPALGGEDQERRLAAVAEHLRTVPAPDETGAAEARGTTAAQPDEEEPARVPAESASGAGIELGESVRVPFVKLDSLLDSVGELVSLASSLDELQRRHRAALRAAGLEGDLGAMAEELDRSTGTLRSMVMDLRLVPVRRVLGRFPTLARQLAHDAGKRVRVRLQGEEAELDKSTVESLADPLLHLVRNAVDHGIETPEEREREGKPPEGLIVLRATRLGDRVRIDVEDDGRGLDRERIRRRARELGLAAPGGAPRDVASLLFRPGFSTRPSADAVSGRGIGLDVVARAVRRAQGSIDVADRPEGGTCFTLFLPLRVAIVPAVFFRRGPEMLALPSLEVRATVRRPQTERVGRSAMIHHRGELVPLADPLRVFGWATEAPGSAGPDFALIARGGDRAMAVAADRLVDQRDAVVKRLPAFLGHPRGVSGVAVDADGSSVLLLEPDGIAQLNLEHERRRNGGD